MRKLLMYAFVAATAVAPVAVFAEAHDGPTFNLGTLAMAITALTPVLVPVIVAAGKAMLGHIPGALIPMIAIGLGYAIDLLNHYVVGGGIGGVWGAVLGAAGIGVREALDQLKKSLLA
jgi:hypothetical protein